MRLALLPLLCGCVPDAPVAHHRATDYDAIVAEEGRGAAIVLIPGAGTSIAAPEYGARDFAEELAADGFDVMLFDPPGVGVNAERYAPDWGGRTTTRLLGEAIADFLTHVEGTTGRQDTLLVMSLSYGVTTSFDWVAGAAGDDTDWARDRLLAVVDWEGPPDREITGRCSFIEGTGAWEWVPNHANTDEGSGHINKYAPFVDPIAEVAYACVSRDAATDGGEVREDESCLSVRKGVVYGYTSGLDFVDLEGLTAHCDNEDYWATREPLTVAGGLTVPYHRLQSFQDHNRNGLMAAKGDGQYGACAMLAAVEQAGGEAYCNLAPIEAPLECGNATRSVAEVCYGAGEHGAWMWGAARFELANAEVRAHAQAMLTTIVDAGGRP